MVIAVPLVPYADKSLHGLVSATTPSIVLPEMIKPRVEANSATDPSLSWGRWAVSLFSSGPTASMAAAQKALYRPHSNGEHKDITFYNREIRFVDSKVKELENKAFELKNRIDLCDDKIEKFSLEAELCGMEEVLLGLKYDLIADIEELAILKFGAAHQDETDKIHERVEAQRAAYDMEARKILEFHDYCLEKAPVLRQRDRSRHEAAQPLPSLSENRKRIEQDLQVQPSSYDFLKETETGIHARQKQVAGLESTLQSGQWPVDGRSLTKEERKDLRERLYNAKAGLEQARADVEIEKLAGLKAEKDHVESVLAFQEAQLEALKNSRYAQYEEYPIELSLLNGPLEHLLPARAKEEEFTVDYLAQVVDNVKGLKIELEKRITDQEAIAGAAGNRYQDAAYQATVRQTGTASARNIGAKAGTNLLASVHDGAHAFKRSGAAVVGSLATLGAAAAAKARPDVVSDEYKDYEWARTPWGKLIIAHQGDLGKFTSTVNPMHDEYRSISAQIHVNRGKAEQLKAEGKDAKDTLTSIGTAERDLEDLRILIGAANLKRLVDTMKPYYEVRNANVASIREWNRRIESNKKNAEKMRADLLKNEKNIATESKNITDLEATLAGLTGLEKSLCETQISKNKAQIAIMEKKHLHLNGEIQKINEKIRRFEKRIDVAKTKIVEGDKPLAILNEGFEDQLLEYQGLVPPARPFGELLARSASRQLLQVITFGYVNEFYVDPAQFRLQQQLAEIGYTPQRGKEELWGTTAQPSVNGEDQSQVSAFLKAKTAEFLAWSETQPELAQAIAADLSIALAVAGGSDALTLLTTGVRSRATLQAALGRLGRQHQIAPPKLTEKDLQWIYLAEWAKELPSAINVTQSAVIGLGATLAGGPLAGGLAALSSYLVQTNKTEFAQNLTRSISADNLRPVHSMLMKASGNTLLEIAGQEQKLNALEAFSNAKNLYLRPSGVIKGIWTSFSQQWTAIGLSHGTEKALRIAVAAVPLVATAGAVGLVGLSLAGLVLGPFGVLGISAALGVATLLTGSALGISNYLFSLANGFGGHNRTWEKVKEARINALFESPRFGTEIKNDLNDRRVAYMKRLHALSALPPTKATMYDFQPEHVKQWLLEHQDELKRTSALLAGQPGSFKLAALKATELVRDSAASTLSPRSKSELEAAIRAEIQYQLLPDVDLSDLTAELTSILDQAVADKQEHLDPQGQAYPGRELHPSEISALYRNALEEMPSKIQQLTNAKIDQFEKNYNTFLSPSERTKMLEILAAELGANLEKNWLEPKLKRGFEYEFKVLAMRYDNEKQFAGFYKQMMDNKRTKPDLSALVPQSLSSAQAQEMQEQLQKAFEPLVAASAGYLAGAADEFLYRFT